MSKPDPSSSNADGSARGDTVAEPAARPARSLDDSWALSGAMAVPEVPGVTDQTDGHGKQEQLPAPPMIPAATPSGPGSNQGAVASVVARAAALRALGAKTMQGLCPAPIAQKTSAAGAGAQRPAAVAGPPMSALQRQAEAESFDAVTQATFDGGPASFEAETQASYSELEDPTRARQAAPPAESYEPSAPVRYQEPAREAPPPAEAPLYLDEPPAMLRLSTGTSDVSVPEIDPGGSGSIPPVSQGAAFLDQSGPGYANDGHHADGEEPYVDSSAPYGNDSGGYAEQGAAEYGHESGFADAGDPGEADMDAASEAVSPAVSGAEAARRAYAAPEGGDGRGEAEWFEASGAQPMADPSHYGHTMQQLDHSFTEPSRRRNRPPGPNRLIAPIAVFVAVSAVVFAGAYFYYRSQPALAPQTVAASSTDGASVSGAPATGASSGASSASSGASGSSSGTSDQSGTPAGVVAGSGSDDSATAPASTVAPGLVGVRFDSIPLGAMVMLVDRKRGITSPVGTTPVRAWLDPKGSYDAIFTLEGHPTKMVSLTDAKAPRVFADLTGTGSGTGSGSGEQMATAPDGRNPAATGGDTAVDPKGEQVDPKGEQVDPKGEQVDPKGEERPRKRPRPGRTPETERDPELEDGSDAVDAAAMGTLSISARPECQISINGKSTGKSTPLRELPLTSGIHKITFINKSLGVNETIAVRVTPGKETKVAQDYTGDGE